MAAPERRLFADRWLPVGIVLLAFGLRVWRLGDVPPGWRDDELINSLVISTKALNGDLALYYPDASGHEALYHWLNAVFLHLFGPNALGIRLLSAFAGTLGVALTYRVGRRLFGPGPKGRWVAAVAAAGLAVSFWSLVYSRIGLRHILLPVFALLALEALFRLLVGTRRGESRHSTGPYRAAVMAGVAAGLGFYVYFAGRGLPLILLAFVGFVALVRRGLVRAHWRGLALTFGLMLAMALPLAWSLSQQPDAEGRVAELAVPVTAALTGDFAPLAEHVRDTLGMFHATGDPEWLYNIPGRPVFGLLGAGAMWLGVLLALVALVRGWRGRQRAARETSLPAPAPIGDRGRVAWGESAAALPYALLLLWWLAGISPGFLSVPPASLGHTILAQPATYLLFALPVAALAAALTARGRSTWPALALALLLLGGAAARDLPDYFGEWPQRGLVRFLYHADARDVAEYVAAESGPDDFAITGPLAGPWNRLALSIDLARLADRPARPRWVNPERALFLALGGEPALAFHGVPAGAGPFAALYGPALATAGDYQLSRVEAGPPAGPPAGPQAGEPLACFDNGLCLLAAVYDASAGGLSVTWRVAGPLDLPPMPLISNPPPPGVYAGPRLWAFGQLVDVDGAFLVGDDGLWVDPETLHPGDVFRQVHYLAPPAGQPPAAALIGLYDPMTGTRVFTTDGADHIRLALER